MASQSISSERELSPLAQQSNKTRFDYTVITTLVVATVVLLGVALSAHYGLFATSSTAVLGLFCGAVGAGLLALASVVGKCLSGQQIQSSRVSSTDSSRSASPTSEAGFESLNDAIPSLGTNAFTEVPLKDGRFFMGKKEQLATDRLYPFFTPLIFANNTEEVIRPQDGSWYFVKINALIYTVTREAITPYTEDKELDPLALLLMTESTTVSLKDGIAVANLLEDTELDDMRNTLKQIVQLGQPLLYKEGDEYRLIAKDKEGKVFDLQIWGMESREFTENENVLEQLPALYFDPSKQLKVSVKDEGKIKSYRLMHGNNLNELILRAEKNKVLTKPPQEVVKYDVPTFAFQEKPTVPEGSEAGAASYPDEHDYNTDSE